MFTAFNDRTEAGQVVAEHLQHLAGRDDLIVLALPRGGVPVADQVARALQAPLDVLVVRKIGAPGQPELAIGAIASGGVQVLFHDAIAQLCISDAWLRSAIQRQQAELESRERRYRGNHPFPDLTDKTVILVDDGLATGATMEAAARALQKYRPRSVIIAVPVAPPDISPSLHQAADEFLAVHQPHDFRAVGQFYRHFEQTSDTEVQELLAPYLEPPDNIDANPDGQ